MDDIQTTHKHKNFLVRKYFEIKLNKAIGFANIKRDDLILDFGCGSGRLKQKLQDYNVIGYDITPEQTDVDNYTKLKPNKIFALDVFEHMTVDEIKEVIKNFKEMNPSFKLITIIPTENKLSIILRRLIVKPDRTEGHITRLKKIKEILGNELKLIKSKTMFTLAYIALYEA